jgi:amino acid transporter
MALSDWLLGKPLASDKTEENKVTVWGGIPILGLDALSSAAYGPEAALTLLIPLGVMGLASMGPIIFFILLLLGILYFSYRQTIHAYPNGGGSYIVASANLGERAGLLAAASLMLDYILTVAVGISSGVGALVSVAPGLHPHILVLCLGVLALVTIVNLRGVKDAGSVFALPTYLFIVSLLGVLAFGIFKTLASGGHPQPVEVPPALPKAVLVATPWLLLRAFASGCTAMTGVEAVSNGIQAFSEQRVKRAQQTLTAIIVILAMLLGGIAFLCNSYHVGATDPDASNYQSVLSQLVAAIVGRNAIYYVTLASVICVLALSANTGFADFPRLCHLVANDQYLPHLFAARGRRLVFSGGIIVLAIVCAVLLIIFGGITDRLIPLYAIGAFMAFTLSQAGMVEHWRKSKGPKWQASLAINALGAICTGITLCIVLVAKFADGAWITVLLIPALVLLFSRIGRHYREMAKKIECTIPLKSEPDKPPYIVVPLKGWDMVAEQALRLARSISPDVLAIHVDADEGEHQDLIRKWNRYIEQPLKRDGKAVPELKLLVSPFRRFVRPVIEEVKRIRGEEPQRAIAVIVPELVESSWFTWPLHNQRAGLLKTALLLSGLKNVIVINVPWYLDDTKD